MRVEKEFWVSCYCIQDIIEGKKICNRYLTKRKEDESDVKITIYWDTPEKKIEITESDFEKAFEYFGDDMTFEECKQKLFHGGEK